jgi:anaerobic selenocysteine-containing dehydrogenase
VREAIAASVPGMEELASIDVAKREFHVRGRLKHAPEFDTASGRGQFLVCAVPLPVASSEYPYTLTTVRSEGQFNTIVYEEADVYREAPHRWCVMMGPDDLASLGLSRGDRVSVRSAQGTMTGMEVVPFDLPAGNLMAYFPEANVLTATAVDARSHTPSFKATAVAVDPLLATPSRAGHHDHDRAP